MPLRGHTTKRSIPLKRVTTYGDHTLRSVTQLRKATLPRKRDNPKRVTYSVSGS